MTTVNLSQEHTYPPQNSMVENIKYTETNLPDVMSKTRAPLTGLKSVLARSRRVVSGKCVSAFICHLSLSVILHPSYCYLSLQKFCNGTRKRYQKHKQNNITYYITTHNYKKKIRFVYM